MNIGIIGAGNIGGNLTRRFQELGHKVFVANSRGPETLADLAAETGGKYAFSQIGKRLLGKLPRRYRHRFLYS